jgi:hypothetical protein
MALLKTNTKGNKEDRSQASRLGFTARCFGSCGKLCVCDKPWVSGFTRKEATASCGRLLMLLDHVFTRDVTVSTSTRTERKVALSGRVIVEM